MFQAPPGARQWSSKLHGFSKIANEQIRLFPKGFCSVLRRFGVEKGADRCFQYQHVTGAKVTKARLFGEDIQFARCFCTHREIP